MVIKKYFLLFAQNEQHKLGLSKKVRMPVNIFWTMQFTREFQSQ